MTEDRTPYPTETTNSISGRQFTPTPSTHLSTKHGDISRLSPRRYFAVQVRR
jgi:nitrate reductase cytochrome c-type subunit